MTEHRDWYTISELAERTSMSRKTIWAWIRDNKLKSTRYGSQHRIPDVEWHRFLAVCNHQENNKVMTSKTQAKKRKSGKTTHIMTP